MCISFLPFPTAILGKYFGKPAAMHTAVAFYAFGLLLPAFGWLVVWLYACSRKLIDPRLSPGFIRHVTQQTLTSNGLFIIAMLTAFWSAKVSLGICIGLTCLYLMPPKKPVYR
ncbi:MAG: hypothetical protein HY594_03000 [Candidatus Omnitrophica bacterium]|nr:hypothetical protein [Candidatus Omnitrophota bacterium]